jgi:hypothetical protein
VGQPMELYRKVECLTDKYKNINAAKWSLVDAVETNDHLQYNLYIQKKLKIHITYTG